jgi:hypothetical protein
LTVGRRKSGTNRELVHLQGDRADGSNHGRSMVRAAIVARESRCSTIEKAGFSGIAIRSFKPGRLPGGVN